MTYTRGWIGNYPALFIDRGEDVVISRLHSIPDEAEWWESVNGIYGIRQRANRGEGE